MLKIRLIAALVMIAGVACAVLLLDTGGLAWLLGGVALLGAWEWSRLMTLRTLPARSAYLLLIAVALWLVWAVVLNTIYLDRFLMASVFWWLLALAWLGFPQLGAGEHVAARLGKGIAGAFTLVPAWAALLVLHAQGEIGIYRLFFLLAMIWVADSAAYFAGTRWGGARLAPRISPGKTRAGVYGALLAVTLYALMGALLFGIPVAAYGAFVALCLITTLFSVLGDLFESLFKRQCGVKDSGTLIPGHGGVLDRIDSLTAAAPVFVLGLRWLDL